MDLQACCRALDIMDILGLSSILGLTTTFLLEGLVAGNHLAGKVGSSHALTVVVVLSSAP